MPLCHYYRSYLVSLRWTSHALCSDHSVAVRLLLGCHVVKNAFEWFPSDVHIITLNGPSSPYSNIAMLNVTIWDLDIISNMSVCITFDGRLLLHISSPASGVSSLRGNTGIIYCILTTSCNDDWCLSSQTMAEKFSGPLLAFIGHFCVSFVIIMAEHNISYVFSDLASYVDWYHCEVINTWRHNRLSLSHYIRWYAAIRKLQFQHNIASRHDVWPSMNRHLIETWTKDIIWSPI